MRQWLPTLVLMFLAICGCQRNEPAEEASPPPPAEQQEARAPLREINEPLVNIDYEQIKARGKLIALTGYSAISYFIYKGEPLGFEYELLKLLTEHLGIELEIKIVKNLDDIFNQLNEGKGDLIAYDLTITKARLRKVAFSNQHSVIHQVLVQKLPDNWRQMKLHEIRRELITNPIDLIGKKVYVRKGSSYYARLVNLSEEIGGDIDIIQVPGDVSTEELIRRVSTGEIEYTVADENVALINKAYYSNIDINTAVSFPQRIAWAVRKNSPQLAAVINQWLDEVKRGPTFNVIYNKYYANERSYAQRVKSEYFSETGGKISPHDDIIKTCAKEIQWDWRILASQIYQESEFDPKAKSWVGARGLMQLMPATAKEFGARKVTDPLDNITAGTKYLKWLEELWSDIPDSSDRLKFVLASYNAGPGHVQDAQRLAKKFHKDPLKWDNNVADFMLKKAQKKYYDDDVVQYGYCRGEEPVNYVKEILERYQHYVKFIAG